MTLRLGWFSSGRDEAARNILRTVMHNKEKGLLDISIAFVFSDWEEGEDPSHPNFAERQRFFDLVRAYDLPLITLSWLKIKESWSQDPTKDWRACFGKKMRTMVYGRPFELGVLAGYSTPMDVDSCTRFDLVVLYPTLPGGPRGSREEVVGQVIGERAARHGAMVHMCGPGQEGGTPITFCSFALSTPEYAPLWKELDALLPGRSPHQLDKGGMESLGLFKRIVQEEERRELPLVTYTIKLFADGDVDIVNGRLLAEGVALTSALDLTRTVDRSLQQGQF